MAFQGKCDFLKGASLMCHLCDVRSCGLRHGDTRLYSQHSGDRGKRIVKSSPAWATEQDLIREREGEGRTNRNCALDQMRSD